MQSNRKPQVCSLKTECTKVKSVSFLQHIYVLHTLYMVVYVLSDSHKQPESRTI